MAYSSITKPGDHFETITYSGDGNSTQDITANFQVDWSWIKHRGTTAAHTLQDSVRGFDLTKKLSSNENDQENDSGGATWENYGGVSAVSETNFTVSLGSNTPYQTNASGVNYVAWNWKAGGSTPTQTYTVKVVSDSGNKYRFDDFGTSAVTLDLQEGGTYTFDQSDSSNSGHPLRFSTTSDGSHGGGSEYTTGVTTTGTPGSSGAKTVITVAASAPTLYYYCTQHSGMGGQANTNSTFGSSTTAGFSIVSYTGTGANATVGHGLGVAPKMFITKSIVQSNWGVYHESLGNTDAVFLNETTATGSSSVYWNNTSPTSSVFSLGNGGTSGGSTNNTNGMIVYCFAEKKGYSKFGSYVGNGVASGGGPFIYLGFKAAWFMLKEISNADNWIIMDNRRLGYNKLNYHLFPNLNNAEYASDRVEFRSNGMKVIDNDGSINTNGATYIYAAFAENPFVANDSATAIPTTGF